MSATSRGLSSPSRFVCCVPRSVPASQRAHVHAALVDASVHAFRIGMAVGAGFAVLGGVVALVGIENPRRRVPCADCSPASLSTTGATLTTEDGGTAPAGRALATERG